MNTQLLQDHTQRTVGYILRQAREDIGLSQQAVAERLCLKISAVKDIEDDFINSNLSLTFLRGYIRSYARIVHASEEELMSILEKQVPTKSSEFIPTYHLAIRGYNEKRDGWITGLTWLILFIITAMTSIWWYQDYQAQQKNISNMMVIQPVVKSSSKNNTSLAPIINDEPLSLNAESKTFVYKEIKTNASSVDDTSILSLQKGAGTQVIHTSSSEAGVNNINNSSSLIISFTGDCWLEVLDGDGRELFSGTQRIDAILNFTGQVPYNLRIGAPAMTRVEYQGKLVDLSEFIRLNQVAKFTLANQ